MRSHGVPRGPDGGDTVVGRARPFDSSTLRRSLKTMATLGATQVMERAVGKQVERSAGSQGRTVHAHTDMFNQPYFTKEPAHAGPIGALHNKMLAAVYFGVTTLRAKGGPTLVYHVSWHKPATPLIEALKDLHAPESRHQWLTAHVLRHTVDRGANGRDVLRWQCNHLIPYLTVANGWVYLSSQGTPTAQRLDHLPVFVRRDVRIDPSTSAPVEQCPRVVIFPAHPSKGTDEVRGLRFRTNGALDGDDILRMDEIYKARWPEMENKLKAFKAIGFAVNRDHTLVFATSRGTDGEIERRSAKDDAVQHEIETLCEEPPSKRVFKKIETRVRKQETLRDQVQALRDEPLTKKVRPPTGLELLCKYLQVLLCNALALVLAISPIQAVRALTPGLVREFLWGRAAVAEMTPGCVTLWIDPVIEARDKCLQIELLRLFNEEAPLQLHGARVRLRIAQPRGIDTS